MHTKIGTFKAAVLAVACSLATANALAQTTTRFDLPAQPLADALRAVAGQTNSNILFDRSLVAGLSAKPLKADLSIHEALTMLLSGTGLTYRNSDEKTIMIVPASGETGERGTAVLRMDALRVARSDNGIGNAATSDSGASETDVGLSQANPDRISPAGPPDPSAAPRIEEVIVTATKREENLSDVPLSVQAISGRQLERIGAVNFADYARTIAGVSFQDSGAGRSQIFVRGVSTGGDVDTGKESTVAVYIDETPVTEGSSQPDLKLYDIERVEVLRGPQGTLYGSGALGGTLRVLTKQPRFDAVEGYVQGRGSITRDGGPGGSLDAMINVPLSDTVALRVVGYGIRDDGFIDNGFSGAEDINDEHTWGMRAALRVRPSDALDVVVTGYHQKSDIGAYYQVTDHYPDLVIDQSAREPFDDRFSIANLKAQYDFGFATLTSSTSYFDRHRFFGNDIDWFTEALLGIPRASSPLNYDVSALSAELRLASSATGRLQWLGGLFYLDRDEESDQIINPAGVAPPADPEDNVYYGLTLSGTRQFAGFAEVGYEVLRNFTVTGGVRISRIDRDLTAIKAGALAGGFSSLSGDSHETPVTPKLNLSYKAREGVLVYAQASKGFRIGGVNPGLPPCDERCVVNVGATFDSDWLWNYEIGTKLELLDRALRISAAAFYIDWRDIQLNVGRGDGFNGFLNAGNARSRGIELEGSWRLGASLQVGGQVTFTDAELTRLEPGVTGIGSPGDPVPEVPRWTRSAFAEWTKPFASSARAYVRGDVQYVGAREANFAGDLPMDSYTLVNLTLGTDNGDYAASLFIRNLTDEQAQLRRQFYSGVHDGVPVTFDRYTINTPRTFGVSLTRRF